MQYLASLTEVRGNIRYNLLHSQDTMQKTKEFFAKNLTKTDSPGCKRTIFNDVVQHTLVSVSEFEYKWRLI